MRRILLRCQAELGHCHVVIRVIRDDAIPLLQSA